MLFVHVTCVLCGSVLSSAIVVASCQTRTPDNENSSVITMEINLMLSTQCVLMNVLCPQPSITALIHSTDDDDDDDDGWKLIKLISSAHWVILEPFHVTFWCLSMNLNSYDLVIEPQPD